MNQYIGVRAISAWAGCYCCCFCCCSAKRHVVLLHPGEIGLSDSPRHRRQRVPQLPRFLHLQRLKRLPLMLLVRAENVLETANLPICTTASLGRAVALPPTDTTEAIRETKIAKGGLRSRPTETPATTPRAAYNAKYGAKEWVHCILHCPPNRRPPFDHQRQQQLNTASRQTRKRQRDVRVVLASLRM